MDADANKGSVIFGCVVDDSPRELFQALRLVQSLRWFGGALQDAPMAVCVAGQPDAGIRAELERFGATIWSLAAKVDRRCRAAAFLGRPELAGYDVAVALAPHTLICGDPSGVVDPEAARARPDDVVVFPDAALDRVFGAVGLSVPPKQYRTAIDDAPITGLFDSAVVSVPTGLLPGLASAWQDHAARLGADSAAFLSEAELIRLSFWHKPLRREGVCEKLGLALAVASMGEPVSPLPIELNCPATYPSKPQLTAVRPVICRYQPEPRPRPPGSFVHNFMPHVRGGISDAIDAFNDRLEADLRSRPPAAGGGARDQMSPSPWDPARAKHSPIRRDVSWTWRKRPDLRIVIGGSPRTGNNWLTYLLAETYRLPRLLRIGSADNLELIKPGDPFVLYQHIPPSRRFLDWGADRDVRFVTMTRHPADVFLSLYHLANNYARTGLGGDFNRQYGVEKILGQPLDSESVYDFLAHDFGHIYISLYWVLSGHALVVRYEDLHTDTERTLMDLTAKIMPVGASDIHRAMRRCSKKRMRRKSPFMRFSVRRGATGEGADTLNETHLSILRRRLADELPALGYEI